MDLLGSIPGGGGGGPTSSARSTAQTVFGARNDQQQTATLTPWILGAVVVGILALAAVVIAAIRK